MTKYFCDLCGEPAVKFDNRLEHSVEFGPKHPAYRNDSVQRPMERTQIVVVASLSFRQHETGYGGPPDLCGQCLIHLLSQLVESVRRRYSPATPAELKRKPLKRTLLKS